MQTENLLCSLSDLVLAEQVLSEILERAAKPGSVVLFMKINSVLWLHPLWQEWLLNQFLEKKILSVSNMFEQKPVVTNSKTYRNPSVWISSQEQFGSLPIHCHSCTMVFRLLSGPFVLSISALTMNGSLIWIGYISWPANETTLHSNQLSSNIFLLKCRSQYAAKNFRKYVCVFR